MSIELYAELEQLYHRRKEDKRKLEEEIRKLEVKIYIPNEVNETSEPSKDRKSSRALRKHPYQRSTREPSPIKKYIYWPLHMTARRDKFVTSRELTLLPPLKDPKIREVLIKFILQSRFMSVNIVTFRLRSMTLYLLFGINPDDVLFQDVQSILKWKFTCIKSSH